MTKTRKSEVKSPHQLAVKKRVENSWVLLSKDDLLKSNKEFSVICLPHPGSEEPTWYCLDDANRKVYEVAVFDEPHRSWFIGDSVKSDGKLHFTTLINPTFLVLPKLIEECSSRAVPLEDLLNEKGFDKILGFIDSLEHVADLKGSQDLQAYKYNEAKTLSWLESRVQRVAKVLRCKNIHVTAGAVSSTFVTSSKDDDHIDDEFYLKYAHGLVSQYLPEALADKLEKQFHFKTELIESLGKKRKSDTIDNDEKKKLVKPEPMQTLKDSSSKNSESFNMKATKLATLTNKEKARQKAASGTKTISSFFAKK